MALDSLKAVSEFILNTSKQKDRDTVDKVYKSVVKGLEGLISVIETVYDVTNKTLKDVKDAAKEKSKSIFKRAVDLKNKFGFGRKVEEDEVAADDLERNKRDSTSGTEPPDKRPSLKEAIDEFDKRVGGDRIRSERERIDDVKKRANRKKGGLDGAESVAIKRAQEVEAEKLANKKRHDAKTKKKKGWLGKLLGGIFGAGGLLFKALGSIFGIGGMFLNGFANIFNKGMWWLLKGSTRLLIKGIGKLINWSTFGLAGKIGKWIKVGTGKLLTGIGTQLGKLGGFLGGKMTSLWGSFTSKMGGWMGGLGSKLGGLVSKIGDKLAGPLAAIGSKIGGLFNKAKSLVGLGGGTGAKVGGGFLSKIGSAVGLGKGGILRRAGAWVGKNVLSKQGMKIIGKQALKWGGKALAIASGPVGWFIAAGFWAWDAYDLYKTFAKTGDLPDSPYGRVTKLRMMSYGLNDENKDKYKYVAQIEELTGRFFKLDANGSVTFTEMDEESYEQLYEVLKITGKDPISDRIKMMWFNKRFIPAYTSFMAALWSQNSKLQPGKLDSLSLPQLADLVNAYDVPVDIFENKELPFADQPYTSVTSTSFDEFRTFIVNELKPQVKEKGKASVDPATITSSNKKKAEEAMQEAKKKAAKDEAISTNAWVSTGRNNSTSGMPGSGTRDFASYFGGSSGAGGSLLGNKMASNANFAWGGSTGGNFSIGEGKGGMVDPDQTNEISIPEAIQKAAEMSGVPEPILWAFAKKESSLNPSAKAKTSSATGMFQFINKTWESMLQSYGKKYGLPANASRLNPLYSSLMAAEYMKENMTYIKDHKQAGLSLMHALYLAHFLGGPGSRKAITALLKNPDGPVVSGISQDSINANPTLLKTRTLKEAIGNVLASFDKVNSTSAVKFKGFKEHQAKHPELYATMPSINEYGESMNFSPEQPQDAKEVLRSVEGATYNEQSGSVEVSTSPIASQGTGPKLQSGEDVMNAFNGGAKAANSQPITGLQQNPDGFGHIDKIGTIETTSLGQGLEHLNSGNNQSGDLGKPTEESQGVSGEALNNSANAQGSGCVTVHPIKDGYVYKYTSLFGPRNANVKGSSTDHGGIDIGAGNRKAGIPIQSTGDGKVIRAEGSDSYGKVVYVAHPDGYQTRYAHLHTINVKRGQELKAGDIVGLMGATSPMIIRKNGSMGVHLHYEVRKGHSLDNKQCPKVDPFNFPIIKDAFLGIEVPTINKNGKAEKIAVGDIPATNGAALEGYTSLGSDPVTTSESNGGLGNEGLGDTSWVEQSGTSSGGEYSTNQPGGFGTMDTSHINDGVSHTNSNPGQSEQFEGSGGGFATSPGEDLSRSGFDIGYSSANTLNKGLDLGTPEEVAGKDPKDINFGLGPIELPDSDKVIELDTSVMEGSMEKNTDVLVEIAKILKDIAKGGATGALTGAVTRNTDVASKVVETKNLARGVKEETIENLPNQGSRGSVVVGPKKIPRSGIDLSYNR